MRKIFTLLAVLVVAAGFALNAQQRATVKVADNEYTVKFPVLSTDVMNDSLAYVYKVFDLTKKKKVQYYTVPVYVDTTSHDAVDSTEYATILLQESFDNVTWDNLDTVKYYGIAGDSTFKFQDITTGTSAPWLRVKFGPLTSDSVNISVESTTNCCSSIRESKSTVNITVPSAICACNSAMVSSSASSIKSIVNSDG